MKGFDEEIDSILDERNLTILELYQRLAIKLVVSNTFTHQSFNLFQILFFNDKVT